MASNNKNNKNSNNKDPNNKKRYTGFFSIVLWALILTIIFNYLFSGINSQGIIEVKYSDFRNAVEQGAVELVDMDSTAYTFYLKDGWSMTEDGTLKYTEPEESKVDDPASAVIPGELREGEKTAYQAAPMTDAGLIPLMEEQEGLTYGPDIMEMTKLCKKRI